MIPSGLTRPLAYRGNSLRLMGHDLSKLGINYGSPVYIYSLKRIAQKLEILRDSFSQDPHVRYAMKANSNREILKFLKSKGIGVDVVSGGELKRALQCGFEPRKVIFSGVAKSVEEIDFAINKKVALLNVESPQELDRIGQRTTLLRKTMEISFRLNPNVNPKTHPYITTGFRDNKFGMDESFIPELLRIIKKYSGLKLVGLDFHIGSQLLESAAYEQALKKSIPIYSQLQKSGFALKHFDIGGGFGIPYKSEKPLNFKKLAVRIEKLLHPLGCEIMIEPGRFLVGDAGVLLTKVEYIKKTTHKNFVIVDTGMHHLLRPALYDAYHEIIPVRKTKGPKIKTDIVGPICESSDWLAKDRILTNPKQGDTLCICNVGAYGYVMASDYNLHRKPAEICLS